MFYFIIGLIVGCIAGVLMVALCVVASEGES